MTDSKPIEDRDEKEQEEWYERTRYQVLLFAGGIIVYLLFGLLLWWVLDWYINPQNSREKKDLVQALGLIMAGVAGAIGIYFTWRGQRITQRTQAENQKTTQKQLTYAQQQLSLTRQSQEQNQKSTQAQLENAQEELRLTRQGQMIERFTQAIEQLGSEKLEIKLGGIYSLERTAHEEKNYHWPVMEVLTSYVRRHAARKPDEELRENATPEPDIQAILDVIGRRSEYHRIDKEVEYGTIELNNTDLQGANLQEAHLVGAALQRAALREAALRGANLYGANLQGAGLQGADLVGAVLQGAILQGANLYGANLQGASGITEDQIEWTLGSNETKLGEDLKRPELWSKGLIEQATIIREHIGGG